MVRLRELRLPDSRRLESLIGVQSLPRINTVDVSQCENLVDIEDSLRAPTLAQLKIANCGGIRPLPLAEEYSFVIDLEDDDLGKWGREWTTPGMVAERWLDPRLAEISDAELDLREWNDWSFWEEIRGDADEWDMPDPLTSEEDALVEEGLIIYSSFDEWLVSQRKADREIKAAGSDTESTPHDHDMAL